MLFLRSFPKSAQVANTNQIEQGLCNQNLTTNSSQLWFPIHNCLLVSKLKTYDTFVFLSFLFFPFFSRINSFLSFFFVFQFSSPQVTRIAILQCSRQWTLGFQKFKILKLWYKTFKKPSCMIQEPQDFQEIVQESSRNSRFFVQNFKNFKRFQKLRQTSYRLSSKPYEKSRIPNLNLGVVIFFVVFLDSSRHKTPKNKTTRHE